MKRRSALRLVSLASLVTTFGAAGKGRSGNVGLAESLHRMQTVRCRRHRSRNHPRDLAPARDCNEGADVCLGFKLAGDPVRLLTDVAKIIAQYVASGFRCQRRRAGFGAIHHANKTGIRRIDIGGLPGEHERCALVGQPGQSQSPTCFV